MTTQQLVDDLEKRNLAAQQALNAMQAVAPGSGALAANAIVGERASQALDALDTVSPGAGAALVKEAMSPSVAPVAPAPVAETPAVAPVAFGTPGINPNAPDWRTANASASPVSFYDMILQNDAIRNKEKEDWDRREKSDKARTTIAAVTDALASLGNLVGTTQGAFSQPQTYQTPFITEQVERDRALARSRADMLYNSDNSLRMAQARYDQQLANIDRQLAVQDKMTERELAKIQARAELAAANAGYRSDQIAQQGDIRKDVARMNNESAERRTAKTAGVSRANALTRDAFNRDKLEAQKNGEIGGGSGGVGGYTTETNIEYNDMGQKVRETKSRTGANGQTTTTTTTTTPSKTPPSKQKKENSKTPPSKRK